MGLKIKMFTNIINIQSKVHFIEFFLYIFVPPKCGQSAISTLSLFVGT